MASVRITYPLAPIVLNLLIGVLVWLTLANGLLGTAFDGLAGGRLEFFWYIGRYRHSVAIVGQAEDPGQSVRHMPCPRQRWSSTETFIPV